MIVYDDIEDAPRVDVETLEGYVLKIVRATGISHPVDAFVLAKLLGIRLVPIGGSDSYENVVAREIRVGMRARPVRLHGSVAHATGHIVLADEGANHLDEVAASYLGGALRLHREAFLRELGSTDWDLAELAALHPLVSAEALVVRMTQVSPATGSVWDGGHLKKVYGEGEHDVAAARELVDQVLTIEQPIRDGDRRAWPVFDGRFRRVFVVNAA